MASWRVLRAARLALLIALLTGCSREPATPEVAPAAAAAVPLVTDPWVVQAIESTGPGAAFVAALYPDRWTGVQPRLAGFTALLPDAFTAGVAAAAEPSRWPSQVLARLGVDAPALPAVGWDRGRPLIFALAEPPHDGPIGTIAATTPLRALPGLRHQILIPASDAPALSAALVDALTSRSNGAPRRVPGHSGAVVFTLPDQPPARGEDGDEPLESRGGGDWLAVVPEADLVRIIVVRGGVYAVAPGGAPEPLRPPLAAPRTTGVAALASTPAFGVLLRPQRLAALRTWLGAHEYALTIAGAGADQVAEAERMSLRRLVGCELMYGDELAEVEDWTLALAAEDAALRLGVIVSLTPIGAAIVDAGLDAAAAPLTLTRADATGHLWLRFGLEAARKVLGPPRSLLEADDDLAMTMQECGAWSLFIDPAAPFAGSQRVASSTLAGAPLPVPPPVVPSGSITQIALTELRVGDVKGAINVHAARGLDAEGRAGVTALGALLGASTEFHAEAEGDGHRTRIGFGVDPRAVFGAPAPSANLMLLRLELGPVVAALAPAAPGLAAALRPHPRLELLARRSGQALEAELVLGDAAPRLHDLGPHTWPAPVAPIACSLGYARALHRLLRAAEDPTLRRAAVKQGLHDVAATLDCPELAAVAPALLRAGLLIIADTLADRARIDDARQLLRPTCTAGDAVVCARLEALRDVVPVALPVVSTSCPDRFTGGHTLAVSGAGITLDGEHHADAGALHTALLAQMLVRRQPADLALDFDAGLTLAALRPVLAALRDNDSRLFVSVLGADSPQIRRIPLAGVEYDPGAQAVAIQGVGVDEYLDAYTLHVDRVPVKLQAGADPKVSVPLATEIPAGARLHVSASDASTWGAVAAALARGCEDTHLVDPSSVVARALTPKSPPPSLGKVTAKAATVRGDLDADSVRSTVRAHINEVRYCHQQALRRDPKAGGRVAIQFTISADGKVRQSAVAESTLRDPADAECIAKAFRRWLFPRPEGGGSVDVTYPFALDPG